MRVVTVGAGQAVVLAGGRVVAHVSREGSQWSVWAEGSATTCTPRVFEAKSLKAASAWIATKNVDQLAADADAALAEITASY